MRSEMDDTEDLAGALERVEQALSVATVHLVHHQLTRGELSKALDDALLGRAEVVDDDRLVTRRGELDDRV
jgi:hypothetical protein